MRSIPTEIKTGCPELDDAWTTYSQVIFEKSDILIQDTEDDLNWHAFLGHSIDMQGFRAAEFSGVDELSKTVDNFIPLNKRGIGVAELGELWEIEAIQSHLLHNATGTDITTSYDVLKKEGGDIGASLAEAFASFPFRKGHKYVRALLQNSAELKKCNYSFRQWLEYQCCLLGCKDFPPVDFRQTPQGTKSLEDCLCEKLEGTFFMVGPEMAPYMLCDWQLWLWKKGRTELFDTFKLDSFHAEFIERVNAKHGIIVPLEKRRFVEWWHNHYPSLPPRLANECIWLYMEDGLFGKSM